MASFLWIGFNCLKTAKPLPGDNLLLSTMSQGVPGTHLTDRGKMKGWVELGATHWYRTRGP